MSNLLQVFTQPKVVVTAPDGKSLWIDPLESDGSPGLLSQFKISTQFGDAPTDDPNVTTSPSVFAAQEGLNLAFSPGPLGLPWGLWVAGIGYGIFKFSRSKQMNYNR